MAVRTPPARRVERKPRPRPHARFGAAYFRRYYLNPATRVTTLREMRIRARAVAALLMYAEIPVRNLIDLGCGIGLLKRAFAEALPRARYTGIEASDYLCRRYGWTAGSVVDHRPERPADLAVCYDVLQYLDAAAAGRAIANFRRVTRAALYVSALTREDWEVHCDRQRTDRAVHLRDGDWYRRRLRRHFRHIGLGVWLRKDVSALLWDLERR